MSKWFYAIIVLKCWAKKGFRYSLLWFLHFMHKLQKEKLNVKKKRQIKAQLQCHYLWTRGAHRNNMVWTSSFVLTKSDEVSGMGDVWREPVNPRVELLLVSGTHLDFLVLLVTADYFQRINKKFLRNWGTTTDMYSKSRLPPDALEGMGYVNPGQLCSLQLFFWKHSKK